MAFIEQSALDIKRKLQRIEGLQDYTLQDLVKEAEKVYHKRETEEEKEQRKEKEREEKENKREKRQEKNLTRILAAVVGENKPKPRAKTREDSQRNLGNRPPLDKDQCAYYKEYRHWKRECPKRPGRAAKQTLALQEDSD